MSTLSKDSSSIPFPERAVSPLPSRLPQPSRHHHNLTTQPSMSALSGYSGTISETRKKQGKRDEALRKKIESELARKRTISSSHLQKNKRGTRPEVGKGTVAALRPSPALTVPEHITVADASQLCAAKRTDCVLVVDEDEGLSGIFTAKDLAYRVTAEGLDPRSTLVSQIMTKNPMVTRDTTSATEALQLMVSRHFRHLPVCNEEGNVVGLLDITKVFHEALAKVERSSNASEKLFSALAGVQNELGSTSLASSNPQAAAALAYVTALRDRTALPDLTSVMDSRTNPVTVTPKTTVKEAARMMKEMRCTAVCVMEQVGGGQPPRIAGIFTSKDVVLRVIAAGLEPGRCSVVRVMTPHPDVGTPGMTVQDALKKMHNGHYLNLPVMEDDGRLVAVVDVLKLTYATLEQMNQMTLDTLPTDQNQATDPNAPSGPLWGRFFESIGHDDNDSVISGSHSHVPTDIVNMPATPGSQYALGVHGHGGGPLSPEVHPNDSASVVSHGDHDDDSIRPYSKRHGHSHSHGTHGPAISALGGTTAASALIDDGTFVFKFKTPSGRTHRFQARDDSFEHIKEVVGGKMSGDPFFAAFFNAASGEVAVDGGESGNDAGESDNADADADAQTKVEAIKNLKGSGGVIPDPMDFTLSYTDADGDLVLMSSDNDVKDAVRMARKGGVERVVLVVGGGKGWPSDSASDSPAAKEAEKERERMREAKEREARERADAEAKARFERDLKEAMEKEKAVAIAEAKAQAKLEAEKASERERQREREKADRVPHANVAPAYAPPAPVHVPQAAAQDDVFGIPRDMVLPASIAALAVAVVGVFVVSRVSSR